MSAADSGLVVVFVLLSDAQDFFDRGDSGKHLFPAVFAQCAESVFQRLVFDDAGGGAIDNERADMIIYGENFVDAGAAFKPGTADSSHPTGS